jgi:carboxyl-terminal processing protease
MVSMHVKAFLPILALAGAIAAAPAPPAAGAVWADPAPTEAARERLRIFDYVWSEIRDKYYDPSLNGVDWAAVRARYRPRVADADEASFHGLLRAMVGELRDSHTRVLTARQERDRREDRTMSAGVILFEVEGEPVIFDVRPGGPAEQAGLRPGMRVLAVNGIPIAEALAAARAEIGPSSSERAALVLSYLRLVAGPPGEMLRLRLEREDGTPFELALPRQAADASPRFEARRLPSGLLYVRFDRFREPVARLFRAALEANRDAPGLILDLRANTGGDGREGARAIGPLLDRPTLIARLATRTGRPPSALMGLVSLPLELIAGEAGRRLFAGPMVILVNQGTASTSEVIAASLQEQGRARVVGTRSCGCALGVLRYRRLRNGGSLAISEIGLVSGLGRRIEGEGVRPDVPVELRLRDLRAGRDEVLAAAERELGPPRR